MYTPRLTGKKGFSLTEVLVVAGILVIVGGGIFSLLLSTQTLFPMATFRQELLNETNLAVHLASEWLMESNLHKVTIEEFYDWDDPDNPLHGTDYIEFQVPYAIDGVVQLDEDGEVIWGNFTGPEGRFELGLVDITDEGGGGGTADAGKSENTMFALKRYLSELVLPSVYAIMVDGGGIGGYTPPEGGLEAPEPVFWLIIDGGANSWVLGRNITDIQFAIVNERIAITMEASKTDQWGREFSVSLTTEVTPLN